MKIRNIRFHIDPMTGEPHIYDHGVDEDEVRDILEKPVYDSSANEGARSARGANAGWTLCRSYLHS